MANSSSHALVLSTCPDPETAQRVATVLVENRLAACVNILPQVRSVFRWQGRVESEAEHLLLIKTSARSYPALVEALREHHPYEVPEIVRLPIEDGLAAYLAWIDECTEGA